MSAKAGGGSAAGRRRAKNQEMAKQMKLNGVVRKVARCPICAKMHALSNFYQHLATHK